MTSPSLQPAARLLSACALALAVATAAPAADPPVTCEAKKLQLAGRYSACRLRAVARALLRDTVPDFTRCAEQLAAKMAAVEARIGAGVCPTTGDQPAIAATLDASAEEVATLVAGTSACPPGYETRTPDVVVADTLDAIAARDTARLACNYHEDAYLIDDQGVLVGSAEIIARHYTLADLVAGGTTTVREDLVFRDTVRLLFDVEASWFVIEDGTETYVVRGGRIRQQTWHGIIEFTGPPPE